MGCPGKEAKNLLDRRALLKLGAAAAAAGAFGLGAKPTGRELSVDSSLPPVSGPGRVVKVHMPGMRSGMFPDPEASRVMVDRAVTALASESDADRAYNDIIAAAKAEAHRIRAEGDKDAAVHYEVFAKNESLHKFWRELQALATIVDESTRLILSTDSAPFTLLDTMPESLLPSDSETGDEE